MGATNTNEETKITELTAERQRSIFDTVAHSTGLPPESIEKDWWVTQVLHALYSLPYRDNLSFKGGTSLSKCWNLIERFSEDIDLGIDREYLGFEGDLSKTQISDKLRRAACSFVREKLQFDLLKALEDIGLSKDYFEVKVDITSVTTTDPEVIKVAYRSVYPELNNPYLPPVVKTEVSGRSMSEPVEEKEIESLIDSALPNSAIAEKKFIVRAVLPERTFLEKVFLLQEEYCKTELRVERMSRHIYDLVMMMEKKIDEKALKNEELYRQVLEHRRTFIGLKGFNYDILYTDSICIVPTEDVSKKWKLDYELMQENMIWGISPKYEDLILKLMELNKEIKSLGYKKK